MRRKSVTGFLTGACNKFQPGNCGWETICKAIVTGKWSTALEMGGFVVTKGSHRRFPGARTVSDGTKREGQGPAKEQIATWEN